MSHQLINYVCYLRGGEKKTILNFVKINFQSFNGQYEESHVLL